MFGPSVVRYLRAIALQVEPHRALLPPETPLNAPLPTPPPIEPTEKKEPLPPSIHNALQTKIVAELRPVLADVARLETGLGRYQAAVRLETERRVENAVLVALGLEQHPPFDDEGVYAEVRAALTQMCLRLGGSCTFEKGEPAAATPVPTIVRLPTETFAPLDDMLRKAGALIDEIEALSGRVEGQPQARFEPLLQALVAEARYLLGNLPHSHPSHTRLSQLIPMLTAMKTEAGVIGFIKGLAYGSDFDWTRISHDCRRQVAKFDRDTRTPVAPPRAAHRAKDKITPAPITQTFPWPALPNLRKMLATRTLVIAGGLVVNEKLDLCQTRFGVKAVWHEIDDSMMRTETLCQRIRSGSVGAVVLLEGLIGHKQSNKVVDACRANLIPYMMGDRGGTASIEAALHALDSKLGSQ